MHIFSMRSFTRGSVICLIMPPIEASSNIHVWLLRPFIKFCICSIFFILWLGHLHSSNLNLSQDSYNDSVFCCSKLTISTLLLVNWLVVKKTFSRTYPLAASIFEWFHLEGIITNIFPFEWVRNQTIIILPRHLRPHQVCTLKWFCRSMQDEPMDLCLRSHRTDCLLDLKAHTS